MLRSKLYLTAFAIRSASGFVHILYALYACVRGITKWATLVILVKTSILLCSCMDFLDPNKRRAHRIRLFIGYGLMAIALGIATTILVYAASGYGVNRKTGQIIQNGMLFVDSHPDAAKVYVNQQEKGETSARYILEAGEYSLALKKDGYRDWQHDFTLEGGSIERFSYPFLFPTELKQKDIQPLAALPDVASASPDRRWAIVHQPSAFTSFSIIDLEDDANPSTSVVVAPELFPAHPNPSLQLVEWASDNRHVLLKYAYDGGYDFVIFDRAAPSASINITSHYGRMFSAVTLRDKQADGIYAFDTNGGVLYAGDIAAKTLNPLATRVVAFWPYQDDVMLFAVKNDTKAQIKLMKGEQAYVVREVPLDTAYHLNVATFDQHMYAAVGVPSENKVYVYRDPLKQLEQSPTTLPAAHLAMRLDGGMQNVNFSMNARFIAAQAGSKFSVYDIENNRLLRYDTKLALSPGHNATWMDGHRLTVVSQSKIVVFEFDGANTQTLHTVSGTLPPLFNRDYTALFSVSPSATAAGGTAFVRTELRVP